jgi:hypothetical protein
MDKGVVFWVLMILWFFFGIGWAWPASNEPRAWFPLGGNLMLFVLLFLLGWAEFGFVIR